MKTLFLVRHAKSSWEMSGLPDDERPLNERGERDAPRMGKRLASHGVSPDILISSPARRAYSTAVLIAAAIGYPKEDIQTKAKLYFEGISGMLDVIHSLTSEVSTAMLFGHNPTMTEAVNTLAHATIGNVPTCGIAEIQFDVESWEDVDEGLGTMQLFDYPKRIKN
jgi:phosphohistidine phosphatase